MALSRSGQTALTAALHAVKVVARVREASAKGFYVVGAALARRALMQRLPCRVDAARCGCRSHLIAFDGAHDPPPVCCGLRRALARLFRAGYCLIPAGPQAYLAGGELGGAATARHI